MPIRIPKGYKVGERIKGGAEDMTALFGNLKEVFCNEYNCSKRKP